MNPRHLLSRALRQVRPVYDASPGTPAAPDYQSAAEASRVGAWERDLATNVVNICPVMGQLLGLPPGDLTPDQWKSTVFEEDLDRIEEELQHAITHNQPFEIEFRVRHTGGEPLWISARGDVVTDESGAPEFLIGVAVDITRRKRSESTLQESEARFRLLAEMSPDALLVLQENVIVYANTTAAALLGLESIDLVGTNVCALVPEQQRTGLQQWLDRAYHATPQHAAALHHITHMQRQLQGSAGRTHWDGGTAIQVLLRDVSAQHAIQEQLRITSERQRVAIEAATDAIWDWDLEADRITLSGGLVDHLQLGTGRDMTEHDWLTRIHADDRHRFIEATCALLQKRTVRFECEYRLRAADGQWRWMWDRGVVIRQDEAGVAQALTGTLTDITVRKENEALAWRHANLDALTGLPNRRLLRERLTLEINRAQRQGSTLAALFLDLDGFKQVNDALGHDAGDELLIEAARRICASVRSTDAVARLGGDEFALLLCDLDSPAHVQFVCNNILQSLAQPFVVRDARLTVSASIGVALLGSDAQSAEALLGRADRAMYAAKAAGKNQFCFFTPEMDARAHARLMLAQDLRYALATQQLALHYQPVVNLRTGEVAKTEALLRWQHPQLGAIAPSEFIPVAEEAGLIADIGNWVFAQVLQYARRVQASARRCVPVAVNVSPQQFLRCDVAAEWTQLMQREDIPGSCIVVEITEGLLLNPSARITAQLLTYRDAGVRVAIDDFGTGYSSMAYLHHFRIDYLKIDQSFIRDLQCNPGHLAIAESVITMAHRLGLEVIAEGIEREDQLRLLCAAGCDYGQGHLFSCALPEGQIMPLLAHRFNCLSPHTGSTH